MEKKGNSIFAKLFSCRCHCEGRATSKERKRSKEATLLTIYKSESVVIVGRRSKAEQQQ